METIPNIDHRFGDGRAEVIGIAVLDLAGQPIHLLEPSSAIVVRISVRAIEDITLPIVGFMMRNHMGLDFAGTNTAREGFELPPMAAGDIFTVDFHLQLPELYPSSFSFSPAIADGTLHSYRNLRLGGQRHRAADEPGRGRSVRTFPFAVPRGVEPFTGASTPAPAVAAVIHAEPNVG